MRNAKASNDAFIVLQGSINRWLVGTDDKKINTKFKIAIYMEKRNDTHLIMLQRASK